MLAVAVAAAACRSPRLLPRPIIIFPLADGFALSSRSRSCELSEIRIAGPRFCVLPIVDLPALPATLAPVAFAGKCALSAEATLVAAVGAAGVAGDDVEVATTEVVVLV